MDRRKKSKILSFIIISLILSIMVFGTLISDEMMAANFKGKNQFPSLSHPFGTDWLGRDMFFRTVKGLRNSIVIGTIASLVSSVIAIIVGGLAGTMPKWVDDIEARNVALVIKLVAKETCY